MPLLPPPTSRVVVPERMDQPGVDPHAHRQALAGLRRINRFSATARQMSALILAMARRRNLKQIRLLDVACGGGDVPIGIARRLNDNAVATELLLIDSSQTALAQAAANAAAQGLSCQIIQTDVLSAGISEIVDVATCSLFLHHLPDEQHVIHLLRAMARTATRMVVISDLVRSRSGFVGAWIGCRLLSRSPIVHFDGPASVRAAWTISALREFAAAAGMTGAVVDPSFPNRMMLVWEKPGTRA